MGNSLYGGYILKELDYVMDNWSLFPQYCFHKTSCSNIIDLDTNKSIYTYILHNVQSLKPKKMELSTSLFKCYQFTSLAVKTPVGYCFIPQLPEDFIVRFTPVCISATGPSMTKEKIEKAEKRVLHSCEFDIVQLSCGAEVITDLAVKLGISI